MAGTAREADVSKRQKVHQLIVTVTHDAPVSQREAVRMFRDAHIGEWSGYVGNAWRYEAGDKIGDTVNVEASFKSVKAYKP